MVSALELDWSFAVLDEMADVVKIVVAQSVEDCLADGVVLFESSQHVGSGLIFTIYDDCRLYFRI